MVRDGRTYRLLTDLRASVRLVVDAATGEVAQRLDYDEYGRVLQDTCPGFQPFGFAGGLYDPATGLVRFGARDYDPQTGRFTAADPQLFGGGDTNLYNYALCDPVNLVDPSGLAVSDIAEWWLYRSELPGPNGSGNPDSWGRGNWNATGAYVKAHGTKAEKIIYGGALATALFAAATAGGIGTYEFLALDNQSVMVGYRGGEIILQTGQECGGTPPRTFFRLNPLGDRGSSNPFGRRPHYHRRPIKADPGGGSPPGQGLGPHRPWQGGGDDVDGGAFVSIVCGGEGLSGGAQRPGICAA